MSISTINNKIKAAQESRNLLKNQIDEVDKEIYALHLALQTAEATSVIQQPLGTRFKWISKENPETYRIAIKTKEGVLQAKTVTNGVTEGTRQLFEDEQAWYESIENMGGRVITLSPYIDPRAIHELCIKPLTATEDALKLKELEERFPGGVFVLSAGGNQVEIKSHGNAIYCVNPNLVCFTFAQFFGENFHLMVKWRGDYIHL